METNDYEYSEDSSSAIKDAESILRNANAPKWKRASIKVLELYLQTGCAMSGLPNMVTPPKD